MRVRYFTLTSLLNGKLPESMAQTLESYPEEALLELIVEERDARDASAAVLIETVLNNASDATAALDAWQFNWKSFARHMFVALLIVVAFVLLRRSCNKLRRRKRQ